MDSSLFFGLIFFFLLVAFVSFIWWIVAVIDAVKRPEAEWAAAQQDRTLWLLGLILGGFIVSPLIATVLYWLIPRPKLDRVRQP